MTLELIFVVGCILIFSGLSLYWFIAMYKSVRVL